MARKSSEPIRARVAKARKPAPAAKAAAPKGPPARTAATPKGDDQRAARTAEAQKPSAGAPAQLNGAGGTSAPVPAAGKVRSVEEARRDLLARAGLNSAGAALRRSDPLDDAKAVRQVAVLIAAHAQELARRGLAAHYTDAAVELARELESHLAALPAAAVVARGRSPEIAELLADAAATAHGVREAVARVTRGPEGRHAAHAFGLGEPFNARQPAHVLRALLRILEAARAHPQVAADVGLLPEDLQTMKGLADELAAVPGAKGGSTDETASLFVVQGALRAWFDLVSAKATIALAGDPDERARVLSLLPRADERRHRGNAAEEVPAQ